MGGISPSSGALGSQQASPLSQPLDSETSGPASQKRSYPATSPGSIVKKTSWPENSESNQNNSGIESRACSLLRFTTVALASLSFTGKTTRCHSNQETRPPIRQPVPQPRREIRDTDYRDQSPSDHACRPRLSCRGAATTPTVIASYVHSQLSAQRPPADERCDATSLLPLSQEPFQSRALNAVTLALTGPRQAYPL